MGSESPAAARQAPQTLGQEQGSGWLWSPALPQAVDVMLAAAGQAVGLAGM